MTTITESEAAQIADTLTREGWTAAPEWRARSGTWVVRCSHPPELFGSFSVTELSQARGFLRRISQPSLPIVKPFDQLIGRTDRKVKP